jgi:hypothetical protein
MRRIAISLILAAAVVGIHACAADAPTAPRPGAGGGTPSSAVSVQLVTSDANPKAGSCTLIEAFVTLNGSPVPDGTTVNFSTDFGAFGQNGLALVSVVTTNGAAATALCGASAGTAKVKGTATVSGKTNSGTLTISFQSGPGSGPQVSSCNPSFGPKEGGTTVTLTGTGFPASSPSTTRVQFTVNGITRDGVVSSVTSTTVVVQTPGFPELSAPATPAPITLTFNGSIPPVVLSLPSCFFYGTTDPGTPTVTAVLPASGTKSGNTRVTVVGSGFSTTGGVQVFFGTVEATVVSVSYNQVVVLSPPAPFDPLAANVSVPVTVKNIASGLVSNDSVVFSYTPDMHITAIANATQRTDVPFTPVTIYGTGFQAPVSVTLADVPAYVQSVSATEVVVMPGTPTGCGAGGSGAVVVTNITSGERAQNPNVTFTYIAVPMAVTNVVPSLGQGGTAVELDGQNLPTSVSNTRVLFGARVATVQSANGSVVTVTAPPGTVTTNPNCTGTNTAGTLQVVETVGVTVTNLSTSCNVVAAQSFSYELPCVVPTPAP